MPCLGDTLLGACKPHDRFELFQNFRGNTNIKACDAQPWEPGSQLAPITLLLGPNSADKTSVLQAPLLLKQTFNSPDRTLDMNLGGQPNDLVDLGSFDVAVYGHDPKKDRCGCVASQRGGRSGEAHRLRRDVHCDRGASYTSYPDDRTLRTPFRGTRQANGGYLLDAPDDTPKRVGRRVEAKRSFKPKRSIAFTADALAEFGPVGAEVQDLSLSLIQTIAGIAYLGPLGEYLERTYL